MNDKPDRAKRNTKPLTADEIVKKVRAIYATQARRIAELKSEDEIEASKLIGRAENDDEHAAARAMLSAVGIVITVIDAEYDDVADEPTPEPAVDDVPHPDGFPDTDEESHYAAQTKAADLVPERIREPLSEERKAVARGGKR